MRTLIESSPADAADAVGAPVFLDAGRSATGEYTCADCRYGVAVRSMLPVCPMCGGLTWEPAAASPRGPAVF